MQSIDISMQSIDTLMQSIETSMQSINTSMQSIDTAMQSINTTMLCNVVSILDVQLCLQIGRKQIGRKHQRAALLTGRKKQTGRKH
jgi:prefoldin subunit 5